MSLLVEKVQENSEKEAERVLLRDFTHDFRHGYCYYGEKRVCLPSHYEDVYQKVLDFEVKDDDTFIVSFPKTGTTWSQEMVWLIGYNLDYEGAKVPLKDRFPFIEVQGLFAHNQSSEWMGHGVSNSLKRASNLSSPRFIKSHLPWQLLPKQIQKGTKTPKVIYICRNPKDCVASYYYHATIIEGYKGNFDDFFELFINDSLNYAPFWGHILDFWERRHDENILFLRYEDMKTDLKNVLRKVAVFLGKSYTKEEIDELAVHLSFDSMKNNPAVNYQDIVDAGKSSGNIKADGRFMRSGKVGSFKIQLSPAQIAQMDKWSKDNIEGTDFEPFPI